MSLEGMIPTPDLFVSSSQTCDSGIKTLEVISAIQTAPSFFLDQPYRWEEEGVRYYEKELSSLIGFMEVQTGRKLDIDRLREAVKYSQQAAELFREINQLRKTIPHPMPTMDYFRHILIFYSMAGTPEAVDYFRQVREEIQAQIQTGKGPVVDREEYRLLSLYVPFIFDMSLLAWMEKDYQAVIPMDSLSYGGPREDLEPDRPIESIARKGFFNIIARVLAGSADTWAAEAVEIAREYQVHGAFFAAHIGCKQACGAVRMIKDALKKQVGIPTLVVDCDILDGSVVPSDQIKSKFEGFFELLAG